LPKWQVKLMHSAIHESVKFIKEKYNLKFEDFDLRLKISNTCRFAKYYHNIRLIRIDGNEKGWNTYERKRVGVSADNIYIGIELSYILQLIHELTHYVQELQRRKFGEVETTNNEIEYVKQFHSYLLKQLKTL